jgi:hypothetical protein
VPIYGKYAGKMMQRMTWSFLIMSIMVAQKILHAFPLPGYLRKMEPAGFASAKA